MDSCVGMETAVECCLGVQYNGWNSEAIVGLRNCFGVLRELSIKLVVS